METADQKHSADAASRNIPIQGHCVDGMYCLDGLVVAWGSRGRRFESGQPDQKLQVRGSAALVSTLGVNTVIHGLRMPAHAGNDGDSRPCQSSPAQLS